MISVNLEKIGGGAQIYPTLCSTIATATKPVTQCTLPKTKTVRISTRQLLHGETPSVVALRPTMWENRKKNCFPPTAAGSLLVVRNESVWRFFFAECARKTEGPN